MKEMHQRMHGEGVEAGNTEEEPNAMKEMHQRMHGENAETSWEECKKMHENMQAKQVN